jgi:hypothetical protein
MPHMRSRIRHIVLLALGLLVAPRPAAAWTYGDTLTTIMRPLPNLPALVQRGSAFTVWALAPSAAGGWSASLQLGALTVPLTPSGGGWQASKGRWELSFTVPPETPEEVYALLLSSDATTADRAEHAVKVLPGFRSDYYFAQISDTHLPTHALSSNGVIDVADTSGMADFDAVIEDLNVIHPEFIIHTGDLVNEGELEEYLGMYEMGRAQGMLSRLLDPVFVSSGNHDIGGWGATLPPDGTSRMNWWRYFGWPWLLNPPAGDPYHSQDFTFDYGPLHLIGLEAYINNGSYDHYRQDLWGAQSFTAEQMAWLQADIAAQPPGTKKLAFYHYDFGGTLANGSPGPNFSQINPAVLGLDAAIWGHNHGVAEGSLSARPINLGLRSVIDRRQFRIFRVSNGVITPGAMHAAGGISTAPTDSMALAWSGPNDGTRSALSLSINNRYAETWDHARIRFAMADHDSSFAVTGGTLAQTIREGGMSLVYVDCVLPAKGVAVVGVQASEPLLGVGPEPAAGLALAASANPFRPGAAPLMIRWSSPQGAPVTLDVLDLQGRRVVTLVRESAATGERNARWDGRDERGGAAPAAMYLVRLRSGQATRVLRLVLVR